MKRQIMGFALSKYLEQQLEFLIQGQEDLKLFKKMYFEEYPNSLKALARFREYKQKINYMDYHEFTELYCSNPKAALEKLFQRPVDYTNIVRLDEILKSHCSLYELYSDHMRDRKNSLSTWLSTAKHKQVGIKIEHNSI